MMRANSQIELLGKEFFAKAELWMLKGKATITIRIDLPTKRYCSSRGSASARTGTLFFRAYSAIS